VHRHTKEGPISDRGAKAHGGTGIVDRMAKVSSCHGVVETGAGGAIVSSLLGEGRPEPPPPFEAVWNSSVESSIMVGRGDGGPLLVEPMKVVPKSLLLGERHMPLK
jgi:hypothetical protein